jgi:hypothetical protein
MSFNPALDDYRKKRKTPRVSIFDPALKRDADALEQAIDRLPADFDAALKYAVDDLIKESLSDKTPGADYIPEIRLILGHPKFRQLLCFQRVPALPVTPSVEYRIHDGVCKTIAVIMGARLDQPKVLLAGTRSATFKEIVEHFVILALTDAQALRRFLEAAKLLDSQGKFDSRFYPLMSDRLRRALMEQSPKLRARLLKRLDRGALWVVLVSGAMTDKDNPKLVSEILKAGVDLNRRSICGATPLTALLSSPYLTRQKGLLRPLLAAGASPSLPGAPYRDPDVYSVKGFKGFKEIAETPYCQEFHEGDVCQVRAGADYCPGSLGGDPKLRAPADHVLGNPDLKDSDRDDLLQILRGKK